MNVHRLEVTVKRRDWGCRRGQRILWVRTKLSKERVGEDGGSGYAAGERCEQGSLESDLLDESGGAQRVE